MTRVNTEPAADGPHAVLPQGRMDFAGQPRARNNDYSTIEVPRLGGWVPELSVSVVIPVFGRPEKLALVLAALAAQSYPAHLMEVVVVDDGSPEPLSLPPVRPENTRLVLSDPGGWGSAHAVNCGVAASSGQVVLRLDADMVVYREHVEAHMRWHHAVDYSAVLGHKLCVDFVPGAMSAEFVAERVRAGQAGGLFDRETAEKHWVERPIDRNNALRTAAPPLTYKVFVGASGSLHRALFYAAGGLDREMVLGGDSEFAYRVSQEGALFVPEPETSSWHLGKTQMQTQREAGTRYRRPYIAHRVPDFHLRRQADPRQWQVPYLDVVLDVQDRTLEEADTTVSALLDSSTPDIRVWLVGGWSDLDSGRRSPLEEERLDLRLIRETFRGEPRIRFAEQPPATDPRVPFRLYSPVGPRLAFRALAELVAIADNHRAGLVCAPLPGATNGREGILRLERTCAFARAGHLEPEATGRDLELVVEEVTNTHWLPGEEFLAAEEDPAETQEKPHVLQNRLARAQARADWLEARAKRAERKLRWLTPGLVRRALRRIVR